MHVLVLSDSVVPIYIGEYYNVGCGFIGTIFRGGFRGVSGNPFWVGLYSD